MLVSSRLIKGWTRPVAAGLFCYSIDQFKLLFTVGAVVLLNLQSSPKVVNYLALTLCSSHLWLHFAKISARLIA